MPATFVVADTHFGHENACTKFTTETGEPLRPFSCAEEMDEYMVKAWNERVRPNDKVYHLGDVVINRKSLVTVGRLNGDKVLIKGNHDIFKINDYLKYFRDVRAYQVMKNFILSHVPVHPDSLSRFKLNIHGHTHSYRVLKDGQVDNRYICVSVEQLPNFAPITLEEILYEK